MQAVVTKPGTTSDCDLLTVPIVEHTNITPFLHVRIDTQAHFAEPVIGMHFVIHTSSDLVVPRSADFLVRSSLYA